MTGNIDIRERDIEILKTLFESRLMTLQQATLLHFDGRKEAAKKRIQKLKAAGLIKERARRVYHPSILHLSRRGFDELAKGGHLARYPRFTWANLEKRVRVSDQTLRHELEVMDVKAALCAAVAKTDRFRIIEFSTWPVLYQFTVMAPKGCDTANPYVPVKPDGFIRIHETTADGGVAEHTFFLELDRGSESQGILAEKARCYREYYRSGAFAERNGLRREEFQQAPFIVLMVFKSATRRNNTAENLLNLTNPILSQVWLATAEEMTADPLGSIWVRPKDYPHGTTSNLVSDDIL